MPSLVVGDRVLGNVEERKVRLGDGSEVLVVYDMAGLQILAGPDVTNCGLASLVKEAPQGLILEFGVAKGNSIRELAGAVPNRMVYGFDWWKGLPHDWNAADLKGCLAVAKPADLPDNVELIEGLFGDTLEAFLVAHPDPVAFVHIDCDLFCPCIFLLHCLVDRFVTGSIIAFDEFNQGHYGEREAWRRYLQETHQEWDFVGKQHAFGEVYRKA